MYKKLSCFFMLLTAVLIINCKISNVYAADNEEYQSIEDFMINLGYDAEVISKLPVYDASHNINGYMYLLSPAGFVVTDENGVVLEANQSMNVFNISEDIYYGGYGEYYYKDSEELYTHIITHETVSTEYIEGCIAVYNNIKNKLYVPTETMQLSILNSNYVSGMPYTYTSSGTVVEGMGVCGYVAAAIYIDYYERYVYSGLMLPQTYKNNSINLINALYSCGDGGTGISQSALINTINSFMNNNNLQGYLYMTGITSDLYSKYCYSINRNRPAIVAINNHNVYGHHYVVGYGYYTELPDPTSGLSYQYMVVNDGWGNNGVVINKIFMESVTYSVD